MGLILTTIWSAAIGQTAVAAIFGIFAAFWLSYFILVTGLIRGWFGIAAADVVSTVKLFLITWLVIVLMLTLATLRLPVAFTAVFVLVALTVLFVLLAYEQTPTSSGLLKTGGYFLLAAAAGGVYLFFNSLSLATGGNALPLGRPTLKG
jgi:succinate-acetate transporter protein